MEKTLSIKQSDRKNMEMQRIIGRFTGQHRGPLLIGIGGLHGNEPAGIKALEQMFSMLKIEPLTNPQFSFNGRLLGIRGNLRAMKEGKRFIVKDLNRQWSEENIERVLQAPSYTLDSEDQEMKEIIELVRDEIEEYRPDKTIVLDFHTTTAFGGIFCIPTNDPESIRIAAELHAPVITGLLDTVKATSLHYFNTKNFGREMVPICFESGQHNEELSVHRAIAALTNCMRTIGCVKAEYVENRHDSILIEYSKDLPKVAELINKHTIEEGDDFRMEPGYKNFQRVKQGELLARDKNGPIYASADGLILMPLYQKQGNDGFFLIKTMIEF